MTAKDLIAEAFRGTPREWIVLHDDFIREGTSNVPDTMNFDVVKDASAAVTCEADQPNGILLMSSAATTNDDGTLTQSINEFVKPTAGKRFAMEVKVKASDADQADLFFGLAQRAATNPENCLTASNRIGFQVNDENASILCKSEAADIETSKDSEADLADDTYVTLGLAYDGSGNVDFQINDNPVARISSNIPATELAVALFQLSGNNTGTHTARCDYVTVVVER
jgi:hypothetical protein